MEAPDAPIEGLEPLVSIAAACRVIGISDGTLYRLLREGELSPIRLAGRTLFEPAELRRFVAARRVPLRNDEGAGGTAPSVRSLPGDGVAGRDRA